MAETASMDQGIHLSLVALCAIPVLYFVPAVIAAGKEHPQPGGVFFVNLFLGWTVIGWFVALFWAIEKGKPVAIAPAPIITPAFTPELAAKEIEDLVVMRDKALISEDDYLNQRQAILARWASATARPVRPHKYAYG